MSLKWTACVARNPP